MSPSTRTLSKLSVQIIAIVAIASHVTSGTNQISRLPSGRQTAPRALLRSLPSSIPSRTAGRSAGGNVSKLTDAYLEISRQLSPNASAIQNGLFHVHIEKCGESFFTTLKLQCCPRLPEEYLQKSFGSTSKPAMLTGAEFCDIPLYFHGHRPYSRKYRGLAAGMFRHPKRRIISAYMFGVYLNLGKYHKRKEIKLRHRIASSSSPVLTYANIRLIQGCQTKFVLGQACHAKMRLTQKHVQKAINIVRKDFAFVGITDEWVKSIFLFHGMFGGAPREVEFGNVRKSHYNDTEYAAAMRQLDSWNDPYDGPLFEAVQQLVNERVQRTFGTACSKTRGNLLCEQLNLV
eukprot:TRINITY_DN9202_c1_g1_i3.p1 TRINITY_DN9202_c1_g1~~TRINITY_DN9202_c1_g1_i3.p1  ORF type:complete len:345 (+),score=15.57 TRINITY_DN9202_c1_g1_i3:36-1070(+)